MYIRSKTVLYAALSAALLISLTMSGQMANGVAITVAKDIYVQPVAEFRGSGGYPDIITIENEFLKVTSIPKRGRIIHDIVFKDSGNSQVFAATSNLPLETKNGYLTELGGFYTSLPWNPRDNQPYDLDYEIVTQTPEAARIKAWGIDFDTKLRTEYVLTLKRGEQSVHLEVTVVNDTEKEYAKPFLSEITLKPGGELMSGETHLSAGVSRVTVLESSDNWLGDPGTLIPWTKAAQPWGSLPGFGRFRLAGSDMQSQLIGAFDPQANEYIVLRWGGEIAFDAVEVWAWGPNYTDTLGAYPGFHIRNIASGFKLAPGEKRSFTLQIQVSKSCKDC